MMSCITDSLSKWRKISNPTILSRKSNEDLANYFEGLGWNPYFVEGTDPQEVHEMMAKP